MLQLSEFVSEVVPCSPKTFADAEKMLQEDIKQLKRALGAFTVEAYGSTYNNAQGLLNDPILNLTIFTDSCFARNFVRLNKCFTDFYKLFRRLQQTELSKWNESKAKEFRLHMTELLQILEGTKKL